MKPVWKRGFGTILVMAAGLVCSEPLAAQTVQVMGRVSDPTGAVIPYASILVRNMETGLARRTSTNHLGFYSVPLLPPGKYRIIVRKDGFHPINRGGLVLKVGRKVAVEFVLDVGTIAEEIKVSSAVPTLNSQEASLGQVIGNRRIIDMPLNGRDYIQLALLTVGTVQPIGGRAGGFSVGGQRTTQNNYLLDGMDNNSVDLAGAGRRSEMVKPSIDAVREFKVQTNSYAAEFGRAMGGVVNVATKSGTNQLHGTAFWFLRNEALDARNFFDPPEKSKPPFKRNQFGFSLGGPIVRGRTFFFGDFEGTLVRESLTTTSTIPTAPMRRGDFTGSGGIVNDPLTGQPFPGQRIPASRFDPLSQRLINLYPDPQTPALAANYVYQSPDREDVRKLNGRIDHSFGTDDNVFARVSFHDRDFPAALQLPAPAFAQAFDGTVTGWNAGVNWNRVFTADLIGSFRFAWNYAQFTRANPAVAGEQNLNAVYGVPGVDTFQPGGFAAFQLTGYRNLGLGAFNGVDRDSQNRQIAGDLTWNRCRHSLKFGANVLRSQNNIFNIRKEVGIFRFNGKFSGDTAADFLLGQTESFDWSNRLETNLRGWLIGLYVQDDWKLTPRFTLNLGARYEVALPWVDRQDRLGIFDIDTDPRNPKLLLAGMPEAGNGRMRRSLVAADTNNIMPRVGLVYKLAPKTVLRAGFGMFYGYMEPTGDAQYLIGNPPFAWEVNQSSSPARPVFQLSEGPGPLSLESATALTFSSFERRPPREYSMQWNLNLQREFAGSWLLEVGYAGARGVHLQVRHEGNFSPPGPGRLDDKRPYRQAAIPGTGIIASPLGPVVYHHFSGNVTYHALISRVEKRFSQGFTLLASYTFSRAIGDTCGFAASGNTPACGYQDPRYLRRERSVDNQDVPHRFVFSGIWEIPFGSGRRWGARSPSVVRTVLGDWSLGSIISYSSGRPFNLVVRGNPANTGSLAIVNRPDVTGASYADERSITRDFNVDAFVTNQQFQFGNLGRNALRQRGAFDWDFSAYKNIPIREGVFAQFRFEAFQFTNTPRFLTPGYTLDTADFGRITAARTPRNLQLGVKLLF